MSMSMSSRKQVPHFQLCQGTLKHFQVPWAQNTFKVQVGEPTWTWICTHRASTVTFPVAFFCREKSTCLFRELIRTHGSWNKVKRDSCTAVMQEYTQQQKKLNLLYATELSQLI